MKGRTGYPQNTCFGPVWLSSTSDQLQSGCAGMTSFAGTQIRTNLTRDREHEICDQ